MYNCEESILTREKKQLNETYKIKYTQTSPLLLPPPRFLNIGMLICSVFDSKQNKTTTFLLDLVFEGGIQRKNEKHQQQQYPNIKN